MNAENITVIRYDASWQSAWDQYVESHPDSCFSHLTAWSRVVASVFAHQSYSLLAVADQRIRGILPLFLIQHWLFGKFLVSAPAANSAGILATDAQAEQHLLSAVYELADQLDVNYVEIRQESRKIAHWQQDDSYITTRIMLDSNPGIIESHLSGKIRRDLNRATQAAFALRQGQQYLEDFHRIYKTRMRQLGSPAFGMPFFQAICEQFSEKAVVVTVRQQTRTVAANIAIHYRNCIYNLFAGADKDAMKQGVVSYFCWSQIQQGCAQGMQAYDFGRSTIGTSSHHYKSFWQGQDIRLYYGYILRHGLAIPNKHPTNQKYKMAVYLWRKTPMFICDRLGPKLVKYLL